MKLDFHKVHDTLRWDFLDYILQKMGFGLLWTKWIQACVSSASSILINGSPSSPFKMFRGLRQGNPLISFLFSLVDEVFNRMVSRVKELNIIEGIGIRRQKVNMSYL